MHEALSVSSDSLTTIILSAIVGAIAWFFKRNETMAEKRIDKLESQQDKNTTKINDMDTRLVAVESSYVKQSDMRCLVDALRDEMYQDLDKSFTRIHDRIDKFFTGVACEVPEPPKRNYKSESPGIDYGKYDH